MLTFRRLVWLIRQQELSSFAVKQPANHFLRKLTGFPSDPFLNSKLPTKAPSKAQGFLIYRFYWTPLCLPLIKSMSFHRWLDLENNKGSAVWVREAPKWLPTKAGDVAALPRFLKGGMPRRSSSARWESWYLTKTLGFIFFLLREYCLLFSHWCFSCQWPSYRFTISLNSINN